MFGIKKILQVSSKDSYDFVVAMGGLLLKQQNFKKVKLIFGHPVQWISLFCFELLWTIFNKHESNDEFYIILISF